MLCQFCGVDLQPRHGLLGTQFLDDDSSAVGLTTGFFFSKSEGFAHAAVGGALTSQPDTVIHLGLLSQITRIAEVVNADAAADEQLAAHMLQLGNGAPNDPGGNNVRGLVSAFEGHQ